MKKVFIKTFGCQMNVYDSEKMLSALEGEDYATIDNPDEADLILLNTCHIREKAAEKVYSDLGRFKSARLKNPQLKIGVTGCVAQAEGAEIIRRQPMVDMVIGPQSYHRLPDILRNLKDGEAVVDTQFPKEDKFDHLPTARKSMPLSAFLSVQEGCDKFCTFCVVPYTRGAERSRPVEKIIKEAEEMVNAGVREITLLGQNVNAYHGEDESGREISLAMLINRLSEIPQLMRIRFTTSHPMDMTDDLYEAFRDQPKLMPFFHLPIQSGSDRILKLMNRPHTRTDYMKIMEKLWAARPDLALSGDFIVGFPEETDQDFEETLSIVKEAGYAHGFSFKYSPRPGTPAAERVQVEPEIMKERLTRLQDEINQAQFTYLDKLIGQSMPVLWEGKGKEKGQISGRSPYLFPVVQNQNNPKIGEISEARIGKRIHATLIAITEN